MKSKKTSKKKNDKLWWEIAVGILGIVGVWALLKGYYFDAIALLLIAGLCYKEEVRNK